MNELEIAKTKVDRAIKLVENFEKLNEGEIKRIFLCLKNALEIMPTTQSEKYRLYSYLNILDEMELKKFGVIFKVTSPTESFIIKKTDMEELVWTVNSLTL